MVMLNDFRSEVKHVALEVRTPADVLARKLTASLSEDDLRAFITGQAAEWVVAARRARAESEAEERRGEELARRDRELERELAFQSEFREKVREPELVALRAYAGSEWRDKAWKSPAEALCEAYRLCTEGFASDDIFAFPEWREDLAAYESWAKAAGKSLDALELSGKLVGGCSAVMLSGKRKGEVCGLSGRTWSVGVRCWYHRSSVPAAERDAFQAGACHPWLEGDGSMSLPRSEPLTLEEMRTQAAASGQVNVPALRRFAKDIFPGGGLSLALKRAYQGVRDSVRLEVTAELLGSYFTVSGVQVRWGEATLDQHRAASVEALNGMTRAGEEAARHDIAVQRCQEAGVSCLADLKEKR